MKNNEFNNFEFLRIYKGVEIKNKACEYSQMDVSFSLGIKPCAKKRFITFALLFCIYEKQTYRLFRFLPVMRHQLAKELPAYKI